MGKKPKPKPHLGQTTTGAPPDAAGALVRPCARPALYAQYPTPANIPITRSPTATQSSVRLLIMFLLTLSRGFLQWLMKRL